MTDFQQLANDYVHAWNEQDGDRRRQLVEGLFEADASYVDPMASVRGTEAISGLIGAVQAQFPGHAFPSSAHPMTTTTTSAFSGAWRPTARSPW